MQQKITGADGIKLKPLIEVKEALSKIINQKFTFNTIAEENSYYSQLLLATEAFGGKELIANKQTRNLLLNIKHIELDLQINWHKEIKRILTIVEQKIDFLQAIN